MKKHEITFAASTFQALYEFNVPPNKYLVKWIRQKPDADGTIIHHVTVHRWIHVAGDLYKWDPVSDVPVPFRKWLPTEKRSRKLLSFYL